METKKVLFVCTGNSCRSPMAEGLLRKMVEGEQQIDVFSAGTAPLSGLPSSKEAVEVMKNKGIDITNHKSHQVTLEDIGKADLIITMTERHKREVLSMAPKAKDKIFLLKEFDDNAKAGQMDVADPVGLGIDVYQECLREIKNALPNIVLELLKDGRKSSIAIGCDHGGYELKEKIKSFLREEKYGCVDFGCFNTTSVDYPDYGKSVAKAVSLKKYDRGVLVCSTGVGMSMVANKVKGVRAALCHNELTAKMSREHNNANILVLGEKMVTAEEALKMVTVWLNTEFEGGRHERRVSKIMELDN
ncbi:ribose 5-phosphate isomerase B [Candidatus Auribacterota bacterium]